MNRMFQVVVVGGLSLTGYACGRGVVVEGRGGTGGNGGGLNDGPPIVNGTSAVTVTTGSFPNEGPATTGAGGFPSISGVGGASGIGGLGGAGGSQGLGGAGGSQGIGGGPPDASADSGDGGFPAEAPPLPPSPRP